MNIIIINGPNLNMLGARENTHYGLKTLDELKKFTEQKIEQYPGSFQVSWKQSNVEGEIVNFIQDAIGKYDGMVINPGGYSHTSVAILDSLLLFKKPKCEVHISRASRRGDHYREKLITANGVDILLEGLGDLSYFIAVQTIYEHINMSK